MRFSYNWIQNYFSDKLPEPKELAEILTMKSFEVEEIISHSTGLGQANDDFILEIDVLPNRSHDCLSHYGIARDISVILNKKLKEDKTEKNLERYKLSKSEFKVEVLDKDKCRRYIGTEIKNIKVASSPAWLKEKLEIVGQRSINNIVDLANYIMLSFGQPLHVFDAGKLRGKKIVVRRAKNGEKMTTLDGEEKELNDSVLVISDGDTPLAIAGIRGGVGAEVDENTRNIVVESANFESVNIRKISRKLNLFTDASKRFENEITPELAQLGMAKVVELIIDIAGTEKTEIMEAIDIYPKPVSNWQIEITTEEINKLLGSNISKTEIKNIFRRFNFEFSEKNNKFDIKIPNYRLDLKIKTDLIEEIGRIYGYEKIEAKIPESIKISEINKEFYYTTKIRNILVSHGFSEVYTYSFVEKGEIEIRNPLASDKKFLRSNLTERLNKSNELNNKNLPLIGLKKTKIFEIGKVFNKNKEYLSLALIGDKKKETTEKLSEQFGNKFGIETNLTELIEKLPDPKSYDDLNLELSAKEIKYQKISSYPFIQRDIALWVPEDIKIEETQKLIKENAGELLVVGPNLFDEFHKKERVSYAFNMVFQSLERTLTDEEVGKIMKNIEAKIAQNKGWEVR